MPDAPELDGLQRFSLESDRDSGRFFVGREAELSRISNAAEMWRVAVANGRPTLGVILVSGAPGAGKTALLHHLREHPPNSTAALAIDLSALGSEAELVQDLKDGLAGLLGRAKGALRPSKASINLGVLKVDWSGFSQAVTLRGLGRAISPGQKAKPTLLLIDEVQSATQEQVQVLAALHRGATGLPLVPVLAGLSDSSDVLSAGGISRRAAEYDIRIGQLNEGEPAEAVRMMLEEFRILGPEPAKRRWASAVEALCDRWPQHLKTAMTALARELLRTEGNLERADWERTHQEAASLRAQGYEARRSLRMQDARPLLAEFLSIIALPIKRDHAIEALRRLMGTHSPPSMAPPDFLNHLIHQGVLHDPNGNGEYNCPIPSFRDYLIGKGLGSAAAPEPPGPIQRQSR